MRKKHILHAKKAYLAHEKAHPHHRSAPWIRTMEFPPKFMVAKNGVFSLYFLLKYAFSEALIRPPVLADPNQQPRL